jgi:hypothetical protein
MSPSCTLRRSSHSAKFLLEKKTLQGLCLFRASVSVLVVRSVFITQ